MPHPLNIALIIETSGGGAGRHVLDLAEGLTGCGHKVTVIWSDVRAQESFQARLCAMKDVRNFRLKIHRAVGAADIGSLRALAALLRAHGPFDILHGHSSKAGALVRLLPRNIPGCRIYTPHAFRTMDPTLGRRGRQVYGTIERLLARRSDRIIAVSEAEQAHAEALGIRPDKCVIVVNGATLPQTATRETARIAMGLNADDIAVGFIGRLDAQKDPLRFVDAISLAAQEAPSLRGVVIGDGALRQAAEAHNTQNAIQFLGWQDGPALFPGLDIFCMTSFYEAMPYTLLEALHAGLPIVTTEVGGVAETAREGQNAYILPTQSTPEALAARLVQLAADPARRKAFGAQSYELARTRTIETMVRETLAVYDSALRQKLLAG